MSIYFIYRVFIALKGTDKGKRKKNTADIGVKS